jgi:hypothetical protein
MGGAEVLLSTFEPEKTTKDLKPRYRPTMCNKAIAVCARCGTVQGLADPIRNCQIVPFFESAYFVIIGGGQQYNRK